MAWLSWDVRASLFNLAVAQVSLPDNQTSSYSLPRYTGIQLGTGQESCHRPTPEPSKRLCFLCTVLRYHCPPTFSDSLRCRRDLLLARRSVLRYTATCRYFRIGLCIGSGRHCPLISESRTFRPTGRLRVIPCWKSWAWKDTPFANEGSREIWTIALGNATRYLCLSLSAPVSSCPG